MTDEDFDRLKAYLLELTIDTSETWAKEFSRTLHSGIGRSNGPLDEHTNALKRERYELLERISERRRIAREREEAAWAEFLRLSDEVSEKTQEERPKWWQRWLGLSSPSGRMK